MSTVIFSMDRIICHNTTEAGHDEVYYQDPVVTRTRGRESFNERAMPPDAGPGPAQGGNAGGPSGTDNAAWDCNDSGAEHDQTLDADLFSIDIEPGDHVTVTLSLMESDGDNYADVEARYTALSEAALEVVTAAIPAISVVTVPLSLAADVVTQVFEVLRDRFGNGDDHLGSLTFHLQGDGESVVLTQVGVAGGQLVQMSTDGTEGKAVAHCNAEGEYTFFVELHGTTTKQAEGLTVEAPLTQDLAPQDFVSWTAADSGGASGTWHGSQVSLFGPMGTAFYLHDDYPNFNSSAFTPQLPATGMVELQSQPGHSFLVLFDSPIQDPVLMLGSLGSTLTLPAGFLVDQISGDQLFAVNDNVVTGGRVSEPDSNGTVRLSGTYSGFSFSLEPEAGVPPVPGDGVFLQIGGTPPA